MTGTRRGFATFAVIFVLIGLAIGAFAYFTTLQQRRFLQFKQIHGELAYGLARVAIDLGRTHLEAAVRSPESKVYQGLTAPPATWRADAAGRVVLESLDLLTDYKPLVEDVLKAHDGGPELVKRLGVTFAVRPATVKPFEEIRAGELSLISPREKQGTLFVEAVCVVEGGMLADTEVQLSGLVEFRAIAPALPLLCDFTLFLAEPPRGAEVKRVNSIEADHRGVPRAGAVLVLANGDAKPRAEWGGSELTAAVLARQGWVYVGGDQKLQLNLTFAAREDDLGAATVDSVGEDFHLYQGDPARPKAFRAFADRLANQRIGNDPAWEIRYWDMGMPDAFIGNYLPNVAPAFTSFDHRDLHATLLHLYGKPGAVSPTLVFGKVEAGLVRVAAAAGRAGPGGGSRAEFCLLQSIPPDANLEGFYHELAVLIPPGQSAIPQDVLISDAGQAKTGKFLYLNADRSLRAVGSPRVTADVYREIQSRMASRPYNQSILYLASRNQDPFVMDRGNFLGLPRSTFSGEAADAAAPAREGPHTVPSAAWDPATPRGAFDLRQLAGVMSDARLAGGRASRRLARGPGETAAQALAKAGLLEREKLELGGVVEIPGQVSLPAGLLVTRGGVLVADEIVIEGDVMALENEHPLLLVATKGGIRVAQPARIAASLAAPAGTVSLAGGSDVYGQVVARALDLDRIESASRTTFVRYDPGLKGGAEGATGARRFQIDVSKSFVQVR